MGDGSQNPKPDSSPGGPADGDDESRLVGTNQPTVWGRETWLLIAWLPLLGYAVVIPYTLGVYFLVDSAYPLAPIGSVELVLGVVYLLVVSRDLGAPNWTARRWIWLPLLCVTGATVVVAPAAVVLYFRSRRRATGIPRESWLTIVRTRSVRDALSSSTAD